MGEEKYRLLALYDELFSTGMKYKWDQRVYIDLYAAAGYSRIKANGDTAGRVAEFASAKFLGYRFDLTGRHAL